MRDKRKPMVSGREVNVSPVLIDGLFWVNDGPIDTIEATYISGYRVKGSFADYATALDLSRATIPADSYATCLAEGALAFGAPPNGLVLVDVVNTKAGMYLPPEEAPEVLPPCC